MFFDDGADDPSGTADESSESTASKRARQLAREAEGDSVTATRLDGDERYFPSSIRYLHGGQQPHHLLLLTTSSGTNAFEVVYDDTPSQYSSTALPASTGGVAVFTEDVVLVVVDGDVFEMPYASMNATRIVNGNVTFTANGREFLCRTANSADDAEVAAAYNYLRRQVRERNV